MAERDVTCSQHPSNRGVECRDERLQEAIDLLHAMKVAVDELNYMIAFQGDMSVNLADADARKRALHAKNVLENTKDRIINKILNEADQISNG